MSLRYTNRSWVAKSLVPVVFWFMSGVAAGHVILDEPNGGEVLEVGSVFLIEWHVQIQHDTQNWHLFYSTTGEDGPWISIAISLPPGDTTQGAMHSYSWTVPNTPSDEVRVRVLMDNAVFDYTDISEFNLTIGSIPPVCNDGDLDGYGDPGVATCTNGPMRDCDDADPDVHPFATEVCDDGIDNDCDDAIDLDDSACSQTFVVQQIGLTFVPQDITVLAGDVIEWHFSTGFHTVTTGSPCTPDGRFDSLLDADHPVVTFVVPFDEPSGVIPYFCIPHCDVEMTGVIYVIGGPPIPAVSTWGMVAASILLLVAGTFIIRQRSAKAANDSSGYLGD